MGRGRERFDERGRGDEREGDSQRDEEPSADKALPGSQGLRSVPIDSLSEGFTAVPGPEAQESGLTSRPSEPPAPRVWLVSTPQGSPEAAPNEPVSAPRLPRWVTEPAVALSEELIPLPESSILDPTSAARFQQLRRPIAAVLTGRVTQEGMTQAIAARELQDLLLRVGWHRHVGDEAEAEHYSRLAEKAYEDYAERYGLAEAEEAAAVKAETKPPDLMSPLEMSHSVLIGGGSSDELAKFMSRAASGAQTREQLARQGLEPRVAGQAANGLMVSLRTHFGDNAGLIGSLYQVTNALAPIGDREVLVNLIQDRLKHAIQRELSDEEVRKIRDYVLARELGGKVPDRTDYFQ